MIYIHSERLSLIYITLTQTASRKKYIHGDDEKKSTVYEFRFLMGGGGKVRGHIN